MTFFKKAGVSAKKQEQDKIRAISALELAIISGGLNPQPLPPRISREF